MCAQCIDIAKTNLVATQAVARLAGHSETGWPQRDQPAPTSRNRTGTEHHRLHGYSRFIIEAARFVKELLASHAEIVKEVA